MRTIKRRIGRDLSIDIKTLTNGSPTDLSGRAIKVEVIHSAFPSRQIELPFTTEKNAIKIKWYGTEQSHLGEYRLVIWENFGIPGQSVADLCTTITLVDSTCFESDIDSVEYYATSVDLGIINLEVGVRGDSAYETWLQLGHEGSEEDFINWLQEPARIIAEHVAVSEAEREKAEESRQTAEQLRVKSENQRNKNERDRVSNEAVRDSLEQKRTQAESVRTTAESEREAAEKNRIKSESVREEAELLRTEAESVRQTSESERQSSETSRRQAEIVRKKAEDTRIASEQVRTTAESGRVKAEEARQTAESARQAAEAKRQTDTAAAIKNAEKATTAANDAADKANTAAERADEGANNLGIEDYPEFSVEKAYIADDVVRYAGRLYRFTVAHPAGAWVGTDAETTSVKEELDRAVALKANVDGYYETMRVGTADNLTPRGEASEEIIMNRTAGGNNTIESGDALIKSIKGNSVVMTQLINVQKIVALSGASVIFKDNVIESTGRSTYIGHSISYIEGHYYFLYLSVYDTAGSISIYFDTEYTQLYGFSTDKESYLDKYIIVKAKGLYNRLAVGAGTNLQHTTYLRKSINLIDLTLMFGAGNEPATPEEFARRLGYDSIEQLPYIPYNEGEIVSCNAEGIRTTDAEGDTYERKWATTLHEYFPRGLQAVGNVYDEITPTKAIKRIGSVDLGTLVWTLRTSFNGYCYYADVIDKNKKRLECNVIAAGYVSIPENGTDSNIFSKMLDGCIAGFYNLTSSNSWVYIRDDRYTSVEEFIAGVTGKLLYYELATPEEYTYDELNLSMRVSSGGTEEAIIPEGVLSTPLKIDVVYPIDTYGTIVNNKKNIGNISQLQTSAKTDLVSAINENNQLAKDAVLKKEQELTPEEQTQVQSNIGVKDTIDLVGAGEAQQVPVDIAYDGVYRGPDGSAINNSGYFISAPYKVKKGTSIMGSVIAINSVSVISRVTANGDFIKSLVRGYKSSEAEYNFIADHDMYISFSAAKSKFNLAIQNSKLIERFVSNRNDGTSLLYEAAGAEYNEEKGLWVLNGIELTDEEIAEIYRYTSNFGCFELTYSAFAYTDIRTNFTKKFSSIWKNDCLTFKDNCFAYSAIEYLNVYLNNITTGSCSLIGENIFLSCSKLHTINGTMLDIRTQRDNENSKTFGKCPALKSFRLHSLKLDLLLKDSPLITYNTIKYLIDNAANTGAITITFHPTTYAYIAGTAEPTEEVGGTKDEWMALVTAAQEKQISLVQAE